MSSFGIWSLPTHDVKDAKVGIEINERNHSNWVEVHNLIQISCSD